MMPRSRKKQKSFTAETLSHEETQRKAFDGSLCASLRLCVSAVHPRTAVDLFLRLEQERR